MEGETGFDPVLYKWEVGINFWTPAKESRLKVARQRGGDTAKVRRTSRALFDRSRSPQLRSSDGFIPRPSRATTLGGDFRAETHIDCRPILRKTSKTQKKTA